MQVEVSYIGEHNFDWDCQLEAMAGHPRYSSDMDFSNMRRTMIFNFDTENHGDRFIASIHQNHPEFGIKKECRVEQPGSSPVS